MEPLTLEILQAEMITAMKNKDKLRKDTISSLVQAVKKFGIDNMCKDNITEEQVNTVILKEKKTDIIGKFGCKGYDTFGPFKLVGGIAKGHPDEKDLEAAVSFVAGLQ